MRTVSRILLAASLFVAAPFTAIAETPADGGIPAFTEVIAKCTEVSKNPDIADPRHGICVTQTRLYLGDLAGKPADAVNATLAELVVELGSLPRYSNRGKCTRVDDEIAQAVILVSTSSADNLQRLRFVEIAETILDTCDDGAFSTASILIESSPASDE